MAPSETQELVERFEEFYRDKYSDDIRDLAQEYPDGKRSLYIDWEVLHEFDSDLADDFLTTPRQLKEYAEEALRLSEITDVNLGQAHVRLHNLPEITRISDLRSKHLNSLVSVYGTVIRVSEVVSQPDEVAWECQRCGTLTRIPQRASVQSFNNARKPHECQGCERQGPFQANHSQSTFQDAQSIVVREPLEGTGTEDERASIVVNLNDDLAGSLSVGDHLVVTGVLNFTDEDSDTTASLPDKYLDGHSLTHSRANEHIDLTEEEKKEILELTQSNSLYEDLTASIAPTIEGYEQEKLALLLQLFSGVRKELPDGREIRGDIHVLLVGDPGTAKSVVAQQAARLAPRAALVDGSDASAAGLTSAAAVSSTSTGGDPWTIEGGIIAMANEGLACIDNFDQLSSDAQNALHGVLEHQEINASKATEKRSIPAETSVLATANPKYGRFDEYEPIAEQVDFIPQLISEFDLLFTISDQPDPDHDREVADRVLKTQYSGQLSAQQRELPHPPSNPDQIEEALEAISPPIDHELLQKHITYAQRNCYPKMTEEAQETIKDFYVDLRKKGVEEDSPVPVSARKLEALVRLAEASARIRLSDTIDPEDADRVIGLVQESLENVGVDTESGQLDADFIETGTTKSQRDRIKNLKHIIHDIEAEHDQRAPIDKIIERASEEGISRQKVEHEIEKMKQKGELYEVEPDVLKLT